jgi:hypothetical protein
MQKLIIFIFFVTLLACKRKEVVNQNLDTTSVKKKVKVLPVSESANTIVVQTNSPADTIYPAKILTSGGVFHEDEVDPKSASYDWKGIFKTGSNYYITDTKIKLSRDYDAVLDEEGQKTGWVITPNIKDSSVLLISGLDYLTTQAIKRIPISNQRLLPGQSEQFILNGITYTLFATGKRTPERPNSKDEIISNYKLFLKVSIDGIEYNQTLVSVSQFDEAMTTILLVADIDGDSKPDFIIDTSSDYNAEVPTLYLSKPAKKGHLLEVVGMHTSVGC